MPSCEFPARRMTASWIFSGRRSARSDAGVAADFGLAVGAGLVLGAPPAASASVTTGVEVFSGKTGKPRVTNVRQCCRFFQRKTVATLYERRNSFKSTVIRPTRGYGATNRPPLQLGCERCFQI